MSQQVIHILGWRAKNRGGGLIVPKSHSNIRVEGWKKGRRAHCPKKSSKYWGGGLELGAEGSLSKKVMYLWGWRAGMMGGGLEDWAEGSLSQRVK